MLYFKNKQKALFSLNMVRHHNQTKKCTLFQVQSNSFVVKSLRSTHHYLWCSKRPFQINFIRAIIIFEIIPKCIVIAIWMPLLGISTCQLVRKKPFAQKFKLNPLESLLIQYWLLLLFKYVSKTQIEIKPIDLYGSRLFCTCQYSIEENVKLRLYL